ncbi:hypothetical protein BCV69DRAFT_142766 [Microstroma glucosiphilum]|uniref:LigT-like protein n=1 Tax=Pseudomicrostroma glucosiphilum TaxID=1684307 RepID=A0A316UC00_9BASI|nr:hypothetical protein BCV69DRAFT_142766 [Pseudomicrostroma glucosiphilum]PWN22398.1 hypothetical protein BCV69DRAFT_142766 [Pseudomicrostroma glucosiphilum]
MSPWSRSTLSQVGRGGRRGGRASTGTSSGGGDAYIAVVAYLLPIHSSAAAAPRLDTDPPRSAIIFDVAHGCTEAATRAYEDWYGRLQEIRRKWDDAFPRWNPHITLIPPFVVPRDPPGQLDDVAGRIRTVCEQQPRFKLALDDCSRFKLRAYSNIHLRPSSGQPGAQKKETNDHVNEARGRSELVMLQEGLQAVLPEASLNRRGKGNAGGNGQKRGQGGSSRGAPASQRQQRPSWPFNPHVSLGQARNREEVDVLFNAARSLSNGPRDEESEEGISDTAPKSDVELPVQEVVLLYFSQSQGGPYSIWDSFNLSGPAALP